MTDFWVINILLLVYLFIASVESGHTPNINTSNKKAVKHVPIWGVALLILLVFGIVLISFIYAPDSFIYFYIRLAFVLLILGHARWLSLGKSTRFTIGIFSAALILLFYRLSSPTIFNHNLLIILSISWLGSFLTKLELLNKKRFIFISIIWFVYDIFFVWVSSLYKTVNQGANDIGFPMGLIWGENFIGTGDLLWASMFLAVLTSTKSRIVSSLILLTSNVLLGIYSITTGQYLFFPLLVLWVPIGLGIIKYIDQKKF